MFRHRQSQGKLRRSARREKTPRSAEERGKGRVVNLVAIKRSHMLILRPAKGIDAAELVKMPPDNHPHSEEKYVVQSPHQKRKKGVCELTPSQW
jgi:hypothetical protein